MHARDVRQLLEHDGQRQRPGEAAQHRARNEGAEETRTQRCGRQEQRAGQADQCIAHGRSANGHRRGEHRRRGRGGGHHGEAAGTEQWVDA